MFRSLGGAATGYGSIVELLRCSYSQSKSHWRQPTPICCRSRGVELQSGFVVRTPELRHSISAFRVASTLVLCRAVEIPVVVEIGNLCIATSQEGLMLLRNKLRDRL